jgi:hypothetical protein
MPRRPPARALVLPPETAAPIVMNEREEEEAAMDFRAAGFSRCAPGSCARVDGCGDMEAAAEPFCDSERSRCKEEEE